MINKTYYAEMPDAILFVPLPDSDEADVWIRQNIAETEEDGFAYEADEVYFRGKFTEEEISGNPEAYFDYGKGWTPKQFVRKPSLEERINALESENAELRAMIKENT